MVDAPSCRWMEKSKCSAYGKRFVCQKATSALPSSGSNGEKSNVVLGFCRVALLGTTNGKTCPSGPVTRSMNGVWKNFCPPGDQNNPNGTSPTSWNWLKSSNAV